MDRDEKERPGGTVETIKGDTKDALDEMKERAKAGGEKMKRAVEGDRMPLGERVESQVKEMGDDLKADYDKARRKVRDDEEA